MYFFFSDDRMKLLVCHRSPESESFHLPDGESLAQWLKRIRQAGVVRGVDHHVLKKLHGASPKPEGLHVIAQGDPVCHETTEIKFHVEGLRPLPQGEASVDFKERGFGVDVVEGQLLAEQIHRGPGRDGLDICGKKVPFKKVALLKPVQASPHVEIIKEGDRTEYRAKINGVLDNRDLYRLDLQPVLKIPKGVGYQVGNLRVSANIEIEGDIASGFSVQSAGDITIRGSIEKGAKVAAKGRIECEGGAFAGAQLQAGTHLQLKFAQGAELRCGGDIVVEQYLFDCHLKTPARFLCSGKSREGRGSVVGGVLNAVAGMELSSVGSISARTTLVVGRDLELEEEIEQCEREIAGLRSEIRRQIRLIPVNILQRGWKEKLKTLPITIREQCRQRLQRLAEVKRECEMCESALSGLGSRKMSLGSQADITVSGVLVADLRVVLSDCSLDIYEDYLGVKLCSEQGAVVIKPLS